MDSRIKGEKLLEGIIINNISNLYEVESDDNIYTCQARGKIKNVNLIPAVGDKVKFSVINNKDGIIEEITERKNYIKRPKIANINQIIFVISMSMPKPDLLLLDKQLAFADFLNIKPIICLNKIDLESDKIINEIVEIYTKIGYIVLKTNAKTGENIDKLRKLLKNNISAFSGNSGVGKSTLINNIFNQIITDEGEISIKNKKGKNTTTSIKLYKIDNNSYVADTPGFSSFDIQEIKSSELSNHFVEFNKHISDCEFIGCRHIKERKCGIRQAVINKEISESRYDNYCKIYQELKDKEDNKW